MLIPPTHPNPTLSTDAIASVEKILLRLVFVYTSPRLPLLGCLVDSLSDLAIRIKITMSALLRDAPVGQIIRWVTKNRVLQYPEEKPGFVCPNGYQGEKPSYASDASTPIANPPVVAGIAEKLEDPGPPGANLLTTAPTVRDVDPFDHAEAHESLNSRTLSKVVSRHEMSKTNTRADLEQAYTNAMQQESIKSQQSRPIMPEKTADGVILVDWYETNDQENPQNWSSKKKGFAVLQIYLYTLAVYIG